jgi:tetratricopeptide (TPR) repeat protein
MKLGNRYLIFLVQLGEGYLLAGRRADALELGQRACQLARAGRRRGSEAHALHLLARVAAAADAPEAASAAALYREALALAEELGMRPLLARCHLGLGSLYRRTGEPIEADRHLRRAVALFRSLDMDYWLAQGHALLSSG